MQLFVHLLQERLETCLAMLKNASPTEEDDEEETIRELEGIISFSLEPAFFLCHVNTLCTVCAGK